MPRTAFILVAIIAVLSHIWALGLPFKLDDVAQIPRAGDKIRDEIGALEPTVRNVDAEVYEHDRFRFRPMLWALFAAELAVAGEPTTPILFHVTSLIIHAVASLLLLAILAHGLSRAAAVAGAALFALNAPGTQAVSWIAARPDLMVTAFGLTALFVAQRGGGVISWARAGIIALVLAGAVMSKVSGVAVVAVVVGVGFTCYDRRPGPWLVALIPAALVWCWRSVYLDTWLPSYTSGRSVADADVTGSVLGLPALFAETVAPWWTPGDGNVREPLSLTAMGWLGGYARAALAVIVLTAAVAAARASDRKTRGSVAVGCAAAVVLALPLTFLFRPGGLASMSRSFYPVAAALAPLFGIVIAHGLRRGPGWRLAVAAAALLVFVHVDSLATAAVAEHASGKRIDAQLSVLSRHQDSLAVVIGREFYDHGAVMLGNMVHLRLRPPFARTRHRMRSFDSVRELMASGLISAYRGPLTVYALTEDDRHIRRVVHYPASGASLPTLVEGTDGWAPERPVATREIAALRIARRPGKGGDALLIVYTDTGAIRRSISADSVVCLFGEDVPWLLGGSLLRIRVDPPDLIERLHLLSESPGIEALRPIDGFVWPGGPLAFSVRSPAAARLRIHVRGVLPGLPDPSIHYEFTPRPVDGVTRWQLNEDARTYATGSGLSMAAIPRLFREQAATVGMTSLQLQWRAEALSASGLVVAMSPWRSLVYKP